MKPFEGPQRSVKKLIFILIQLCEMHGAGRVKHIKKNRML